MMNCNKQVAFATNQVQGANNFVEPALLSKQLESGGVFESMQKFALNCGLLHPGHTVSCLIQSDTTYSMPWM